MGRLVTSVQEYLKLLERILLPLPLHVKKEFCLGEKISWNRNGFPSVRKAEVVSRDGLLQWRTLVQQGTSNTSSTSKTSPAACPHAICRAGKEGQTPNVHCMEPTQANNSINYTHSPFFPL